MIKKLAFQIILTNVETGQETTFICKDALLRNDYDLQAEKTFSAQTKQSDDNDDDEKKSQLCYFFYEYISWHFS